MATLIFDVDFSTNDALKHGITVLGTSRVIVGVDGPDDTTLVPASTVDAAALIAAQMVSLHAMPTATHLIF